MDRVRILYALPLPISDPVAQASVAHDDLGCGPVPARGSLMKRQEAIANEIRRDRRRRCRMGAHHLLML